MFYVYADGKLINNPLDSSLEITSPQLTLEMGKAGSFQFGLPSTNKHYDSLQKLKTKITVEIDDTEIFRGRVLSESVNSYNIRTIYCEGDLAYLVDSVQKSEKYTGTTHDLFRKIIAEHNTRVEDYKRFEVGTIEIDDVDIIVTGQSSDITDEESDSFDYDQIVINSTTRDWKTTYDYIEAYIIDYCGGYLRTRREGDTTYLDLLVDFANSTDQQIEFGVNMLDLTSETSAEDLFTVLIPLGDENLTIESVNNGSDELVDTEAVEVYGRITKTHVFENVNKASTLLENGQRYLTSHANIPETITIRAVDMHLSDPEIKLIKIGDSVPVKSRPHNIVRNLNCTKIEYNFENLGNCSFTFGTLQKSLTERYRKDKNKSGGGGGGGGNAAETAVQEAGDKIYDAWINVDKEAGNVSLGALYKELKNTKVVLEQTCGINIDAPSGNVDIRTMRTTCDDLGNKLTEQGAQIDLLTNDTNTRMELLVSRVEYAEELEAAHYASITLNVSDLESSIELKADKVTIDAELTTVKGRLDVAEMNISTLKSQYAEIDTLITNKVSAIYGDVSWLAAKTITVGSVHATGGITASSMICGGVAVATQEWVKEQLSSYSKTSHTHAWSSISDKPTYYSPTSHRHTFSISKTFANGHTHNVVVDGKTYSSQGVSTNVSHSLEVSSYTGFTGGSG